MIDEAPEGRRDPDAGGEGDRAARVRGGDRADGVRADDPTDVVHGGDRAGRARGAAIFWVPTLAVLGLMRLPYLTSPLYILDNDEAVLGIMARRMAAGVEWPLFFAGQNYGLAVFETAPVALAFRLFGDTATVLTLTVLSLFLVGLVPLCRALRHLGASRAWARTLTVVLALVPGWIVWSTKARGLYVSGFVLTGFTLALLTRPHPTRRDLVGAAALMGLTALVQPLWLLVTAPFLLVGGWRRRELVVAGTFSGLVWAVPTLAASGRDAYWQPERVGDLGLRLEVIPPVLTRAFAGRVPPNDPDVLVAAVGAVGAVTFAVLMIAMAVDAFRKRSRVALAVAVAMLASVMHVIVLQLWVPRYFLPSTVLTAVAAAVWLGGRTLSFRGVPRAAALATIVILAATSTRLGRPPGDSVLAEVAARDDLQTLLEGLEADGVAGVYAASSDVQWQLLFYGRSRIPVRGLSSTDRYPEFPEAVAEAHLAGEPTALVADVRKLRDKLSEVGRFPGYRVGERYLRLDEPTALELALLDFEPPTR